MRLPPYPKYKPSGVEWLGEVPEHWGLTRLRDATRLLNGFPFDSDFFSQSEGVPLVRIRDIYSQDTEVLWLGPPIPEAEISDGDILIGMDGDFNVAWWAGGKALLNQRVCCLRSKPSVLFQRFLFYALPFPLKSLNDVTYSTTVKHLSSLDVLRFRFYLPEPQEQRAIADFLDRETAKIDTLVTKKRTLIERLKEKRTALISRTVTRGLPPAAARSAGVDPYPKLKPSGIDWLGDVPEHWGIAAVRRRAVRVQTGSTPPTSEERYYEDGTLPWYGPGSFDEQIVLTRPIKLLHESAAQDGVARAFAPGATFIVTIGATLGKVGSIQATSSCNQQITAVEFDSRRVHARFATYQLKRLEPSLRAIAPSATLPILDQEEISNLFLALPPGAEQAAIAGFLDRETAKIDGMVSKVETAIERLQEYRTALITAGVTGKIDVRGATA
jgi:type I restriction enzyme, S subunit